MTGLCCCAEKKAACDHCAGGHLTEAHDKVHVKSTVNKYHQVLHVEGGEGDKIKKAINDAREEHAQQTNAK